MITSITTTYNQIMTRLGYIFSGNSSYTRVSDPYDLPNNSELFLRKGYGLRYNGASVVDSELHQFAMEHNFSVITTRELIRLENKPDALDDVSLSLLEDATAVQKDFYHPSELGVDSSIRKIDLVGISPIQKVNGEKVKFKYIETSFNFTLCNTY